MKCNFHIEFDFTRFYSENCIIFRPHMLYFDAHHQHPQHISHLFLSFTSIIFINKMMYIYCAPFHFFSAFSLFFSFILHTEGYWFDLNTLEWNNLIIWSSNEVLIKRKPHFYCSLSNNKNLFCVDRQLFGVSLRFTTQIMSGFYSIAFICSDFYCQI